MKFKFIIAAILAMMVNAAMAQNPSAILTTTFSNSKIVPVDQAFVFNLFSEDQEVKADWRIAPNAYLYQEKLHIYLIGPDGVKTELIKKDALPPAETIHDPYFGEVKIYRYSLKIPIPLPKPKTAKESTLNLEVDYQGCTQNGFCYPPRSRFFELKMANGKIMEIAQLSYAPATASPSGETSLDKTYHSVMPQIPNLQKMSAITAIATFYLIGILLTFTPCVLPMIPILFGVIVGGNHLNTRRAFWLSLCYVIPMALTYALAGVLAATIGKNLQANLQKPWVLVPFAGIFIYLGLVQLGVVHIKLPHGWRVKDLLHKIHAKQESGTYLGAAIMGILATLISAPCVTAPLIAALGYISQSGDVVLGGSALLAMGLGMGTILLAMGTLGGAYLPKTGAWMHTVNEAFAIVMFGLAIWLLDRILHGPWTLLLWAGLCFYIAWCMKAFKGLSGWTGRLGILVACYGLVLIWGALQGEENPIKPLSFNPWGSKTSIESPIVFQTIDSVPDLNTLQAHAQQQTQPLMLVFYADWCISCKHIEHEIFSDPKVQRKLKNWELVRADVTSYNEDNKHLLQNFDLIGPPAILFFDKNGRELTKYRIVGESSAKNFLAQLDSIQKESR